MRSAMSQAVPRGAGRARADQDEGDLRAAGDRSPTAARTSPTSSKASSSRTPERSDEPMQTAQVGLWVAGPARGARARVRLHERLPRRRQLDRHRRLDRRAQAAARRWLLAAFFNFVAIFVFHLSVAATVGKGIVDPAIVDHYVDLRRAGRRDRLERHHLVLRHSVVSRRTR